MYYIVILKFQVIVLLFMIYLILVYGIGFVFVDRMNQVYCVVCFEWRKILFNFIDKKVKILKMKLEIIILFLGDDDMLLFIRVIKVLLGQKVNIGKKLKDIYMEKFNLEVNVRSFKELVRQRSMLQ